MAGSMNPLTVNPADVITGPLEKHFPVSSGTDHREKENVVGPEAALPVYEEPTENEEVGFSVLLFSKDVLDIFFGSNTLLED